MTPRDFCYWLQGHFELNGNNLTPQQIVVIREHLDLVFTKETTQQFPFISAFQEIGDGILFHPDPPVVMEDFNLTSCAITHIAHPEGASC